MMMMMMMIIIITVIRMVIMTDDINNGKDKSLSEVHKIFLVIHNHYPLKKKSIIVSMNSVCPSIDEKCIYVPICYNDFD